MEGRFLHLLKGKFFFSEQEIGLCNEMQLAVVLLLLKDFRELGF